MRARQIKIIGWVGGGVLLVGIWLLFAPAKLGGSTTYSITSGISMEPLLHKNDLVLVRAQPAYKVGDVVLYNSPSLHRPVLHRIIEIQNGNYYFKGDNNNFIDPDQITQSELQGKLWLHMPVVGGILGWFGKPAHAAILATIVIIALVVTGTQIVKRRRRAAGLPVSLRHRLLVNRPEQKKTTKVNMGARAPSATETTQSSSSNQSSYFDGPLITLVLLGICVVLSLICLIVGFSRPARHLAPLPDAYKQTGAFSYTGLVKSPTIVYPAGVAKTGDPIFSGLIDAVKIHFRYQFKSELPHDIKGTVELRALLQSKTEDWQDLAVLKPTTSFTGDSVIVASEVSLKDLYNLIDSVSAQSGGTSFHYAGDIMPIVHITGTVNGKPVRNTFAPVLPFNIGHSVITLHPGAQNPPPGATYTPPSNAAAEAAVLNPSQPGSIPYPTANTVSVARFKIKVPTLRWGALLFAVLAVLIALLHSFLRRHQTSRTEDQIIADQFQDLIVPVTSLTTPPGVEIVTVRDFARLAELAQYLQRPILSVGGNNKQLFAVDDGTCRYVVHSAKKATTVAASVANRRSGTTKGARHLAWRSLIVRLAVAAVLLAIILSLVNTFTAGNTVPSSRVGRSVNARTAVQLRPNGCSTLSLTSIVFKAAGSSSNSTSNALIFGTSGVETLNDTGNNNCIVAGAGADRITTRTTSICIVGPTSGATYTNCTKK